MFKQYYLINGKFIPYISGSKGGGGGKGCFAAGTRIATETGYKNIEEILPGEQVKSFDHLGNISLQEVTCIFYHPKKRSLRLLFGMIPK